MRKKNKLRKMLGMMLCSAVMAASLFAMPIESIAAESTKIVDPDSSERWRERFAQEDLSTEYAGGVDR